MWRCHIVKKETHERVLAIGGLSVLIRRTHVVDEPKVDSLYLKLRTKLELILGMVFSCPTMEGRFLALVEFVLLVPENLNTISDSR
jgi:hypothetical protein